MAAVRVSTAEQRCTLPGFLVPNVIPPRLRAPDPDDVVGWVVASLARLFHRTRGGTRPYARAERLAAALQAGTVTLRPVPIAWLPPPAPRHMLTRSLAAAGSPFSYHHDKEADHDQSNQSLKDPEGEGF